MASLHPNNAHYQQLLANNNPKIKHKESNNLSHHPNINLLQNIKLSENAIKKKDSKGNGYQNIKRQQTPDPTINYPSAQEASKLP
jgi:exonuclease III